MGITGLIPYLEKSSRPINIKEYAGNTVAIDAYCWLHKGAFSCAEKLVMKEPTTMYVSYCMKFVNMLLTYNIKPILVFDGQNLPAKLLTENKRRESRDVNRRKGMELMRAGRTSEGKNFLRRSLDVTHEMALQVLRECRRRNVDCIVAPYEADAQLAYFSINNIAQVIITEDSDLLLFGCKAVLFKMDVNGNGLLIEKEKLHLSMGIRSDNFSLEKFRLMCILSGCDYVDSLPGIGLSKASKFVNKTSDTDIFTCLQKLAPNLNMWSLEVSDEYRRNVVAADHTFRCQLVYDPIQRKQLPLTSPREGEGIVGELKDPNVALELALGNLNPRNLERLDSFNPDTSQKPLSKSEEAVRARHSSIWSQNFKSTKKEAKVSSIFRIAVKGKTVSSDWKPPIGKRNSNNVTEKPDILSLYTAKRHKSETSSETDIEDLLTSRYFALEPIFGTVREEKKNVTIEPEAITCSPDSAIMVDLESDENNQNNESDSDFSSLCPSLPDSSENTSNTISDETLKFSNSKISAGRLKLTDSSGYESSTDSDKRLNLTNSYGNNNCTNAFEKPTNTEENFTLSSIDSDIENNFKIDESAKRVLERFKQKVSPQEKNKFFVGENSISPSIFGVSRDTVSSQTSAFFSSPSALKSSPKSLNLIKQMASKTPSMKKMRTGLSRPRAPQQSLLTNFGFQTRSKLPPSTGSKS